MTDIRPALFITEQKKIKLTSLHDQTIIKRGKTAAALQSELKALKHKAGNINMYDFDNLIKAFGDVERKEKELSECLKNKEQ